MKLPITSFKKIAATLSVAFATTLAMSHAADAQDRPPVHNIVLVHGLFADGSSWEKIIPLLQQAGMNVTAVQNPLTSFADDVQAVQRAIALQDGPTLLVGHSYGGSVITQTGNDPKVVGLVYLSARAPDVGEDYAALLAKYPTPPVTPGIVWAADGFGQLSQQAFVHDFAGDLPQAQALAYYAVQGRVSKSTTARLTEAAWHTHPTWYVVTTQDRTTDPGLQRFLAKRMGATTLELDSSHVSMLSHPEEIAKLILSAASKAAPKE